MILNTEQPQNLYPSIVSAFGMAGQMLLFMLLFAPILFLERFIGKGGCMSLFYFFSVGSSFLFFYYKRKRLNGLTSFVFTIPNWRILFYSIVALVGLNYGIISPITDLIPMPESIKKMFIEMHGSNSLFNTITLVIFAPIFEELIFRGIILDGFLKRYSPLKAILISSILFGLIHLNPWQFVGAMICGILLGWLYYETKSLVPTILIHFINNVAASFSTYYFGAKGMETTVTQFGFGNAILISTVGLLMLIASVYLLRKEFAKEKF